MSVPEENKRLVPAASITDVVRRLGRSSECRNTHLLSQPNRQRRPIRRSQFNDKRLFHGILLRFPKQFHEPILVLDLYRFLTRLPLERPASQLACHPAIFADPFMCHSRTLAQASVLSPVATKRCEVLQTDLGVEMGSLNRHPGKVLRDSEGFPISALVTTTLSQIGRDW